MKYVLCLGSILACFYVCHGLSENLTQEHLSLHQLVNDVIERNQNLAAANARIQAATFVIDRVSTPNDPQFTLATDMNQFGSSSKDDMLPEKRYELSQTLPFPGKLNLKATIARKQLDSIRNEKITIQKDLILQAKKLYYQLLLNSAARRINEENSKIVSSLIKDTLALYTTGKGRQEDVFKAKIEHGELENELSMLTGDRIALKAMLNAFMNRPQTESVGDPIGHFHGKLSLTYDDLVAIAMRERSELRGMNAMFEEQKTMQRLAKLELAPDFTVTGMLHSMKNSNENRWGIGIGFNIPLFYAGKQRREAQEADAKAIGIQNNLEGMRAMIRGQIKELLAKIQSAESRMLRYKKSLIPQTSKTLEASAAKYRAGKGEFLFLLDTRRQLQNFQFGFEQVRVEREILFAELERAIGIPLEKAKRLRTSL